LASDEVSANGRWGGKLTSRPLPESDHEIDALEPEERSIVSEVWSGRAASERRVGDAFVVVRDALVAIHAAPALIELATRAIDDEMRHAELSRRVASRYAGRELAPPPVLPLTVPQHARADARLRHVLHVVGQSCFNETIASAFLEAALAQARAPVAMGALRELLSDEVDHARIGWALLASADAATRRDVEPWLAGMAVANLRMWREAPRTYPDGGSLGAHGVPSVAVVESALVAAFRDLILPGFETLGMNVDAMRAWLESGAPT
jgi:hypothetical protein